jgi:hypothetical protein
MHEESICLLNDRDRLRLCGRDGSMCCTVSCLTVLSKDVFSISLLSLHVHEDDDSEDDIGSVAASIIFL